MIEVKEFFDNFYKQQAQNKNYQSIASYVDGLKPTMRKVIHVVLKDNINSWVKVEGLANKTSGDTEYLGGATNISGVICTISKGYVGSNNVPMLDTLGNFGQRLDTKPGEPRYIKARKLKNMDWYFKKEDKEILIEQIFEDTVIEPRFFVPTLPFLLINGSEGMGSGHAQNILPRSEDKIKDYISKYLKGEEVHELYPHWNGFKGEVLKGEENGKWKTRGVFEVDKRVITITELPIGYNLNSYLKVLDSLEDKKIIKKYEDLSDTKADVFNFKIHVDFKFDLSKENIIQKLKLEKKHAENFTTIDENNSIEIFEDEHELIQAYIKIKLEYEGKRKAHLIQKNIKDIHINASRYIFIKAVTDGDIIVNKKKKTEIISQIEKIDRIIKEEDSYDYLLRMPIYSLTLEKMEDLKSKIIQLKTIVKELESKTNSDMWLEDLV